MNDFYVYAHKTKDSGEIFYIGKGKKGRAWVKSNRSKYWKNIVNKNEFEIEILIDGLSEDEAYLQEFLAIKEFNPKANFRQGGRGGCSEFMKQEWLRRDKVSISKKISKSLTGKKLTKEHKEKCLRSLKKAWYFAHTPEAKNKRSASISRVHKGKKISEEHKTALRVAHLGKKHKPESNLKRAISHGAKPFLVFNKQQELIGEWINKEECARELGLYGGHINKCLNKIRKQHKGYTFKYKEIL